MKGYYVTLRNGSRTAWLLGPFKEHQRAIDAAPVAHAKAAELDQWCHFYDHGTGSLEGATLPPGKLNSILPHLVVDA